MLVVVVSGPPGSGKRGWMAREHPKAARINPDDFFAANPDAGLRRLARKVHTEAKKQGVCAVVDERGDAVFVRRLLESVGSRGGAQIIRKNVVARPEGGLRQCIWQLLGRPISDAQGVLERLAQWFVEPRTARAPDPQDFDVVAEQELCAVVERSTLRVAFFRFEEWGSPAFQAAAEAFDYTVAISPRPWTELGAAERRCFPAGQLVCCGTDAFAAIPGGVNPEEAAMAAACGVLGAAPQQCVKLDAAGASSRLPDVTLQIRETDSRVPADTDFEALLGFGVSLRRLPRRLTDHDTLPRAAPNHPSQGTVSPPAEWAETRKAFGTVVVPQWSELTESGILKHLQGRAKILEYSRNVQMSEVHLNGLTASGKAKGTTGEVYEVSLTLDEVVADRVSTSKCDCAYFKQSKTLRGCKHVAALALFVKKTTLSQRSEVLEHMSPSTEPTAVPPAPSAEPAEPEGSLQVAELESRDPPPRRTLPNWLDEVVSEPAAKQAPAKRARKNARDKSAAATDTPQQTTRRRTRSKQDDPSATERPAGELEGQASSHPQAGARRSGSRRSRHDQDGGSTHRRAREEAVPMEVEPQLDHGSDSERASGYGKEPREGGPVAAGPARSAERATEPTDMANTNFDHIGQRKPALLSALDPEEQNGRVSRVTNRGGPQPSVQKVATGPLDTTVSAPPRSRAAVLLFDSDDEVSAPNGLQATRTESPVQVDTKMQVVDNAHAVDEMHMAKHGSNTKQLFSDPAPVQVDNEMQVVDDAHFVDEMHVAKHGSNAKQPLAGLAPNSVALSERDAPTGGRQEPKKKQKKSYRELASNLLWDDT